MDKPITHRFARLLRVATAWAIALHGFVVPWSGGPLYAKNPDSIRIGMTPVSSAPPSQITDLVASPNLAVEGQVSLTWTAPQGNAGGTPIPNQTVAAYLVQYATYSVADLAGDTTSWWTASTGSQQLLSAPTNSPQAPGNLEALTLSGLGAGTTVYFGIKSISMGGITSPIDAFAESSINQAWAVTTRLPPPVGNAPKRPNGLTVTNSGGLLRIGWDQVQVDVLNLPISVDEYRVYKYDAIASTPVLVGTFGPATLEYTEAVANQTFYYRIIARSVGGVSSSPSDYLSTNNERIAVAPDDSSTRVVLPMDLAQELNGATNSYGEDLEIVFNRRQSDEVDVTLRSYKIDLQFVRTGQVLSNYAFARSGMRVEMGLSGALGSSQLNVGTNNAPGAIAQIVSVYWYNGGGFVRLSDPILTSATSIGVNVRNVGIYQVRATQISTAFKLTQNSPYPRVITPNHPSQNNRVFWFFDNPTGDPVYGTIYDIRGAKVKDLAVDDLSPTSNSLVWNGRDMNGAVVPSGVYLYDIRSGKERATGTIVVAR